DPFADTSRVHRGQQIGRRHPVALCRPGPAALKEWFRATLYCLISQVGPSLQRRLRRIGASMAGGVSLTLIRPADLLRLEFELVNLEVSPDWSRLDRTDEAAEALVIVHFPPQALAEEVWPGA